MSDNGFCLDLLKNRVADLERQVTEKDAIISFLSKQLINKNHYGDSCNGTTVNDHNGSFQEKAEIINNNFPLGQDKKENKAKNAIIVDDSMLNNINSRGLSKSKKVSVSSHPGATTEDILSAVEESLKTNLDTLIAHAATNHLTKSINTLSNVKKILENVKIISPGTKIAFFNIIGMFIGRTNETLTSSASILI